MGRLSGERRGLAAMVLAFYGSIYFVIAIGGQIPDWTPVYGSMAFLYGLAFFALVAGYFWARWYAIGLGLSGLITAAFGLFQPDLPEEVLKALLIFGGTHAAISLLLWGKSMSAAFDGRADWRTRFHLDEAGCHKLGRAVIRATVSLPFMVMYALAPKDGMSLAGFAALALAGTGVYGLVKMRTWGVIALAGAAMALLGGMLFEPVTANATEFPTGDIAGMFGIAAAVGAVIPFAGPLLRYLRSDLNQV